MMEVTTKTGEDRLLEAVWAVLDGIYGAEHHEPIIFYSLPSDLQAALNNLLDIAGELEERRRLSSMVVQDR